jgi:hypothetical protein
VLINEAGKSRQVELTPFGLRLGVASSVGLIVLFASIFTWLGGTISGGRGTSQDDMLVEKVRSLQEELQKKDLALALQEKKFNELEESPALAAAVPRSGTEVGPGKTAVPPGEEPRESNPLTTLDEALQPPTGASAKSMGRQGDLEESEGAAAETRTATEKSPNQPSSPPLRPSLGEIGSTPQSIMNFNAQEVAADPKGPNSGALSFRLIKDQPDVTFSGYLFVFVEMTDQRGENKIFAYPDEARLGEEDLPADFREGKSISFKRNSRVKLPYEDVRPGVSLSRVTILLYGENGRVVFQRSFDRGELKSVAQKSSAPAATDASRRRPVDKRRAL